MTKNIERTHDYNYYSQYAYNLRSKFRPSAEFFNISNLIDIFHKIKNSVKSIGIRRKSKWRF